MITGCTIKKCFVVVFIIAYNAIIIDSVGTNLHMYDGITTHEIIGDDVFFEITEPESLEYTYRLRRAKDFGVVYSNSFKINHGLLVLTTPSNGCTEITNKHKIKNNIALIVRGECSFVTKAINAERAGAVLAIITEINSANDSDYYIEMIHDNSSYDTNIPALYLLGKDGRMILRTLQKLNRHYAVINMPVNLTFTPAHLINQPRW